MKTELRKAVKQASELLKEYDYLSTLITHIKKVNTKGVSIQQDYLNNVIKRQQIVEELLSEKLNVK